MVDMLVPFIILMPDAKRESAYLSRLLGIDGTSFGLQQDLNVSGRLTGVAAAPEARDMYMPAGRAGTAMPSMAYLRLKIAHFCLQLLDTRIHCVHSSQMSYTPR